MKRARVTLLLGAFAGLHAIVVAAGFVAPYDPATQHRDVPFAPPMPIRFVDGDGRFHLRPFVHGLVPRPGSFDQYDDDRTRRYPVRLFVRGPEYGFGGVARSSVHLFGVEAPGRIFLAGTDAYGRDLFSRILYGARISLLAGSAATFISLALALVLGGLAGGGSRWVDAIVMRAGELFLALPWLYVLLAVRGTLPLHLEPTHAFLLVVCVVGAIGWARPARLVRGIILSARERKYVLAARGFGASNLYVLRRHVLPQTWGVLLTQAALLVPHYIVAEVTLSFLGLGLGEPAPSWGTLLTALQQYHVLTSYWWMMLPAVLLAPVVLSYHLVAATLHERLKPVAL